MSGLLCHIQLHMCRESLCPIWDCIALIIIGLILFLSGISRYCLHETIHFLNGDIPHSIILMIFILFADFGLYNILYWEMYHVHGKFGYIKFGGRIEFSNLQKHKYCLSMRCPYIPTMEKEACEVVVRDCVLLNLH